MKRMRSLTWSLSVQIIELLDVDREFSPEQTYRETIYGVRWSQVPEFDSSSSSLDDNPFAGTRAQHTSKLSLKVLVDDWLCWKFEKLNSTVQEGYPSETAGLSRDKFIKPPKTLKWYNMFSEKRDFSHSKVYTWTNKPARLNSSFPRHSLPTTPASRPVSQDTWQM